MTGTASYEIADWTVGLQDRWVSGFSQVTQDGQVWTQPWVRSFNSLDLNIQWKLRAWNSEVTPYFTVENLFGSKPQIDPSAGSIGLVYPVAPGEDIMGRYLTLGIRARL